jgi:alanine-glyoxylate transaminase/serine-glyoxylate transaminase/serine-pyruvate transaminase
MDSPLPQRILLGPGPSVVDPRVYRAMAAPITGHMDPRFLALMKNVREKLRRVFRAGYEVTIPISGTGSAGMEAALVNFLEPGDWACILSTGFFAARMADIAHRAGARVHLIETAWGLPTDPERVARELAGKRPKVLAVVHGETSTGVMQPLEPLAKIARDCGALFVVDTVATLGGTPIEVEKIGIDVCYSGSQKCLGCPPGLAPITASERAMEILRARKTPVQSWYLDLSGVEKYWGSERSYHHTAPISLIYAINEALNLIEEEGLEARWARHARNMAALSAGLAALGLEPLAAPEYRMPMLATVRIPAGVDDARVRTGLLDRFNIEIAGGLGAFKGKLWRIGLMGSSSTEANVFLLLAALEMLLAEEGAGSAHGAGVAAAQARLAAHVPEAVHA